MTPLIRASVAGILSAAGFVSSLANATIADMAHASRIAALMHR